MRRTLLATALAVGAFVAFPDDAKAQFGPVYRPSPGWSVNFNYATPGYGLGLGYQPSYYGGYGWGRGHYDYQPGHFHGYRYIPPHVDYHHRGHYHAVDPFTGQISPYRHRHRHH